MISTVRFGLCAEESCKSDVLEFGVDRVVDLTGVPADVGLTSSHDGVTPLRKASGDEQSDMPTLDRLYHHARHTGQFEDLCAVTLVAGHNETRMEHVHVGSNMLGGSGGRILQGGNTQHVMQGRLGSNGVGRFCQVAIKALS
ncbi:MAG: hypothetical protein ACYTFQ_04380, partial [Planctomycetota bacterium]